MHSIVIPSTSPSVEILLLDDSLRSADVVEAKLTKYRIGAGTRRLFLGELIREMRLRIATAPRTRFIEFKFCVCISAEKAEYTRQLSRIAVNALPELFGCT